jgi:folate-binding protein YgfZ
MSKIFAARLDSRALLGVSGEDAAAFLQGLVSNDVERAAKGTPVHAALLTAQGKFLHEFFIVPHAGALLLDCEAARRDDLKRRLTIYRLRAKAQIASDDARAVWALWGAGAGARLGLDGGTPLVAVAGGCAYGDPRLPALGARAILPRDASPDALGFDMASADDYDRWRLAHGVPDGSRDMEVEKAILLESNFDDLHGVDFEKGCYVGQELTARTKYRGLVKKRLFPVAIEGEAPAPGTVITLDGQDAGTMRSANGARGLALLRLDAVDAASAGTSAFEAAGARLTAEKPGWMGRAE